MYDNVLIKNHLGDPDWGLADTQMSEYDYKTYPKSEWISKKEWEKFTEHADDAYWMDWQDLVWETYIDTPEDLKGDLSELKKEYNNIFGDEELNKMAEEELNYRTNHAKGYDSKQKEICDSFNARFLKDYDARISRLFKEINDAKAKLSEVPGTLAYTFYKYNDQFRALEAHKYDNDAYAQLRNFVMDIVLQDPELNDTQKVREFMAKIRYEFDPKYLNMGPYRAQYGFEALMMYVYNTIMAGDGLATIKNSYV